MRVWNCDGAARESRSIKSFRIGNRIATRTSGFPSARAPPRAAPLRWSRDCVHEPHERGFTLSQARKRIHRQCSPHLPSCFTAAPTGHAHACSRDRCIPPRMLPLPSGRPRRRPSPHARLVSRGRLSAVVLKAEERLGKDLGIHALGDGDLGTVGTNEQLQALCEVVGAQGLIV